MGNSIGWPDDDTAPSTCSPAYRADCNFCKEEAAGSQEKASAVPPASASSEPSRKAAADSSADPAADPAAAASAKASAGCQHCPELQDVAVQPASVPDTSAVWQELLHLLRWITCGVPLLLQHVLERLVHRVRARGQPLTEMCRPYLRSLFIGKDAMLIWYLMQQNARCSGWTDMLDPQAIKELCVSAVLHLPLDTSSFVDLSKAMVRADVTTDVWSGCDQSEGTSTL